MVLPDDTDIEIMELPPSLPKSNDVAQDGDDIDFVWPDDTSEDDSIDSVKYDKMDKMADFDDADVDRINQIMDSIKFEPVFLHDFSHDKILN